MLTDPYRASLKAVLGFENSSDLLCTPRRMQPAFANDQLFDYIIYSAGDALRCAAVILQGGHSSLTVPPELLVPRLTGDPEL